MVVSNMWRVKKGNGYTDGTPSFNLWFMVENIKLTCGLWHVCKDVCLIFQIFSLYGIVISFFVAIITQTPLCHVNNKQDISHHKDDA